MKSRELGLVLAQQLLNADDLHYGLWSGDLDLCASNLRIAQQRYTDMILSALPEPRGGGNTTRILDVGCGTGSMLTQMLDKGYDADGVIPDPWMKELVEKRLAAYSADRTKIYGCKFEAFPWQEREKRYDAVLFSESFQYINMDTCFDMLMKVCKPRGFVVVCDFFRTQADGDGGPGDGTFGGGKNLEQFYDAIEKHHMSIEKNEDITRLVSPNIALVNGILVNRVAPAAESVWAYFRSRHPVLSHMAKTLFGRRFDRKVRRKYLSGLRSKETFERYKTYRLIILKRQA